jgi:hypothetical protein
MIFMVRWGSSGQERAALSNGEKSVVCHRSAIVLLFANRTGEAD